MKRKKDIAEMTEDDIFENDLAAIDAVVEIVSLLVKRRKANGQTQEDVAWRMGVGQSAITRFENMLVIPRADTLLKYANAVGEDIVTKPSEKRKSK